MNNILIADAYKFSHVNFYEKGTTKIYSYLESRGSGISDEMVFFGLQYILKKYLSGQVITQENIDEAEIFINQVFGRTDVFQRERFEYILNVHGGILPLKIKAVDEGSVIPNKNVLMTIENTDPECFWLTNFVETLLLQIWYPSSVASLSRECKKIIKRYLEETSENGIAGIEFALNDFGMRGVSSYESSMIGGASHLINFMGSDTISGSKFIIDYYLTDVVYGKSVAATEHSVCTQRGEEGELDVFKNVLATYPTGIVACVSDSYNIIRACEQYYGTDLKEQILNRDGVLVIRPDSGDPVQTLKKIFSILFDKFGFETNSKGYKVLPSKIRVIQGDGININSIKEIYDALKEEKISAENIIFGMGGKLLQSTNRDSWNMAIKGSYTEVNGESRNIIKNPIEINSKGETTQSFKKSKTGKMMLVKEGCEYKTISYDESREQDDLLKVVFENGKLKNEQTFEQIRENAKL